MAVPVQQMEPSHQARARARARARGEAAASREEVALRGGKGGGGGGGEPEVGKARRCVRCPLLSCQLFRTSATKLA